MEAERTTGTMGPESNRPQFVTIRLTAYGAHALLTELRFGMLCVANHQGHDQNACRQLFQMVATQLNGLPVRVVYEEPVLDTAVTDAAKANSGLLDTVRTVLGL